jgi:hypothetical protein
MFQHYNFALNSKIKVFLFIDENNNHNVLDNGWIILSELHVYTILAEQYSVTVRAWSILVRCIVMARWFDV